jgi:hypothetical protein
MEHKLQQQNRTVALRYTGLTLVLLHGQRKIDKSGQELARKFYGGRRIM